MRINCDVDGVLADFTGHLASWLSAQGARYTTEDFTSYELKACMRTPEDLKLLARAPHDATFCHSMPRYPGAQDFLRALAYRADVTLVTAPWLGQFHQWAREEWIDSILAGPKGSRPAWSRHVEFQWTTPDERVRMGGDLLIEDRAETASAWARTGRTAILMDRPWNRHYPYEARVIRARSYAEALQAIFPGVR